MSDQTKHDGLSANQLLQAEAVALLESHLKWINKLPVPTTGATHQMMNVVGKAIEAINRMNLEAPAPKRPLQEGEINEEWHAAGGKVTGKGACLVIGKWQYHKLRRAIAEAAQAQQPPAESTPQPSGNSGGLPAVAAPDGYAQGVEAVAKMLEKKASDHAGQYGYDDMGSLSFGRGQGGERKNDYYNSLLELAEEARAMLPAAQKTEGA